MFARRSKYWPLGHESVQKHVVFGFERGCCVENAFYDLGLLWLNSPLTKSTNLKNTLH